MGEHRWRGYDHPALHTMINAGPGASASEPQTSYWQGLSNELTEVDTELSGKLATLGSRWEGSAADSAQAGLTPLAAWAGDAQTGATVMKVSSEDQAEFVSDARANMPEVVEVTTPEPSGWAKAAAIVGGPGPAFLVAQQANDHEEQEAAKSAAEEKAVQTMETYESNSTWNRTTLGTFVAPADVVVATPEPQGHTSGAFTTGPEVNNVSSNGTGTSGSGTSNAPGTNGTVHTTPHTSGNTGTVGTIVTDGGGDTSGTHRPPPTNTNTTTNPSDVFVPPAPGPGPAPVPTPTPNPLPGPGPNPGQNPLLPGGGPFQFGTGDNAGDIARRPMPLRPISLPVEGTPFGGRGGLPGGPGGAGGPGGVGGFGAVDGERVPSQLGRGGVLGGAPGEGGVVRSGPGAAGAAGRGGNGVNGPAGAGRRAEDEEDQEHYAPDYLLEEDDVFGDDRKVAPTVIGE
jgi:hypothetical protein